MIEKGGGIQKKTLFLGTLPAVVLTIMLKFSQHCRESPPAYFLPLFLLIHRLISIF